jgi:predicted DNA-binding transcriptional regulator YafY
MGIIDNIKEAWEKAAAKKKQEKELAEQKKIEEQKAVEEAEKLQEQKAGAKRKKLGLPPGKVHYMTYKDKGDEYSHRNIEILATSYKNNNLYLHAFCHLKCNIRTFLADRIIYLECDGQKIKDPWAYINKYNVPPDIAEWAKNNLSDIDS